MKLALIVVTSRQYLESAHNITPHARSTMRDLIISSDTGRFSYEIDSELPWLEFAILVTAFVQLALSHTTEVKAD